MAEDTEALVSIGLPVYNGARFLDQAVDSLLAQSYRNIELILSDNASTDATMAICERYARQDRRVRYSRLAENIGGIPNHNRVRTLARGRYFMWASHDDIWSADYIAQCVAVLESDPSVVLAYSRSGNIDDAGQVIRVHNDLHQGDSSRVDERFSEFTQIHSTLEAVYGVIRVSVLEKLRPLALHPGSDRLLLAELSLHGRLLQVSGHLYMRRIHQGQSVNTYPTIRDRYRWVNPASSGKRVFPHLAYLRGYADALLRAPLGWEDKLACAIVLLRWVRYNWKELAEDFGLRRP